METHWIAKRFELWQRLQQPHPPSDNILARQLAMSRSWVQKWRIRLAQTSGEELTPFLGHPRCRHTSPRQVTPAIEAKIIQLREQLTECYQRRVGARNILYHLQHDSDLKRLGCFVPKSASTVHEVLLRFGRIPRCPPQVHVPFQPAEPMQVWELDFTDITSAQSLDTHKYKHQVELLDIIDTGSSVLLETRVSDHFDAEWTLVTLVDVFQSTGLPRVLRFDRDTRLVTSWAAEGFPSALMRFLLCLGIQLDICPPHRPDRKPYVERVIRT